MRAYTYTQARVAAPIHAQVSTRVVLSCMLFACCRYRPHDCCMNTRIMFQHMLECGRPASHPCCIPCCIPHTIPRLIMRHSCRNNMQIHAATCSRLFACCADWHVACVFSQTDWHIVCVYNYFYALLLAGVFACCIAQREFDLTCIICYSYCTN